MARLPRSVFPAHGVFHLTTRGVGKRDVFLTRDDRLDFLRLLGIARTKQRLHTHVLCLMTNHYHVVVEGYRDRVSEAMHFVNGCYAQSFNRAHGWTGHLWGDRFALWQVRDDEHLEETCAYVMANPVRAGLCASPDEWLWSGLARPRGARRP